jgi:peroxisomal 2,4-dienoyl-CoA reductase
MNFETIKKVFQPNLCVGRVALVTGGGSGIGQEIAFELAGFGAKVVVMGRREKVLSETVEQIKKQGGQALFFQGDVRKEQDGLGAVEKAVNNFGKLDILINAAAGNFLTVPERMSTNAFRTVLDIDAVGTFNMSRCAFEALKNSKDSRIINISATLHLPASWYQVHASAAKAAVDSITRSLALEWGSFGIRVTGIAPGPIADTTGTKKLSGGLAQDDLESVLKEVIPIGRAGYKADIAGTVIFLVSPAGSFVSGDTFIVDGANYLYKVPIMPREQVVAWSKNMEKNTRKSPPPNAKL